MGLTPAEIKALRQLKRCGGRTDVFGKYDIGVAEMLKTRRLAVILSSSQGSKWRLVLITAQGEAALKELDAKTME